MYHHHTAAGAAALCNTTHTRDCKVWDLYRHHLQELQHRAPTRYGRERACTITSTGGVALCRCVACIRLCCFGPCHGAATKEVQGPDTTGRRIQGLLFLACWWCMDAICTLCPVSQKQVITEPEGWVSPHQSSQGRAPSHPLLVPTHPPGKVLVEASLGGKHTSASGSRSEAMDWARGGCGGHFELFSSSLGGQTTELVTSAG
jgi:hypothetical protein